jgi:site-specific recombinase XerD
MALWRLVGRVGIAAGLGHHLSPHALRHLFASWFTSQTGDIYLTMQAMGHRNINTTLAYVDVDRKKLTAAMRPPSSLSAVSEVAHAS